MQTTPPATPAVVITDPAVITRVTGLYEQATGGLGRTFPFLVDYYFLGNSLAAWLVALAVTAVAFALLMIVRGVVLARAKKMSAQQHKPVGDLLLKIVLKTSVLIVAAVAIRVGAQGLALAAPLAKGVDLAVIALIGMQAAIWATVAVDWSLVRFFRAKGGLADAEAERQVKASLAAVRFVILLVAYVIIVIVAMDNFGVNVMGMVAGLGIGGIALALAVQKILGDVFGSLSITLDKPFEVGDYIVVGDNQGTVEEIGIKTTRLRALSGEQLVFGNSDLLNSRIQNFKRMRERRAVMKFGVVYDTPPAVLAQVATLVRTIIESHKSTRFERSHFATLGSSSLDFEAVYWMLDPDFNLYMDTQQAINLELMTKLNQMGVAFAFPTRTVHIASMPPPPGPGPVVYRDGGDPGNPVVINR